MECALRNPNFQSRRVPARKNAFCKTAAKSEGTFFVFSQNLRLKIEPAAVFDEQTRHFVERNHSRADC
jgi:hypothetical protein